jgi:hypothetical protein
MPPISGVSVLSICTGAFWDCGAFESWAWDSVNGMVIVNKTASRRLLIMGLSLVDWGYKLTES